MKTELTEDERSRHILWKSKDLVLRRAYDLLVLLEGNGQRALFSGEEFRDMVLAYIEDQQKFVAAGASGLELVGATAFIKDVYKAALPAMTVNDQLSAAGRDLAAEPCTLGVPKQPVKFGKTIWKGDADFGHRFTVFDKTVKWSDGLDGFGDHTWWRGVFEQLVFAYIAHNLTDGAENARRFVWSLHEILAGISQVHNGKIVEVPKQPSKSTGYTAPKTQIPLCQAVFLPAEEPWIKLAPMTHPPDATGYYTAFDPAKHVYRRGSVLTDTGNLKTVSDVRKMMGYKPEDKTPDQRTDLYLTACGGELKKPKMPVSVGDYVRKISDNSMWQVEVVNYQWATVRTYEQRRRERYATSTFRNHFTPARLVPQHFVEGMWSTDDGSL